MDNQKPNRVLTVSIKSPEAILFAGEADAVSSINERGRFDVLPLHANFICIVKDTIVIYNKSTAKELKIDSGILRVTGNHVQVFLGIETLRK